MPIHAIDQETAIAKRCKIIEKAVASAMRIGVGDMKSTARHGQVSRARHLAMTLIRAHTPMSYPEIARHFGCKNHNSARHAVMATEKRTADDKAFAKLYKSVIRICRSQMA